MNRRDIFKYFTASGIGAVIGATMGKASAPHPHAVMRKTDGAENVGFQLGGANTGERTVGEKLRDLPDVRDYNGADLTGANDMSAALQNYIADYAETVYYDAAYSSNRSACLVPLPEGVIAVSNVDAKACQLVGKGKWRTRFAHDRGADPLILLTGWNVGVSGVSFYDPSGRHSSEVGPCIQINKALAGYTVTTGLDVDEILAHDINGAVIKSNNALREARIKGISARMCGGSAGTGVIDIENNAADLSRDVNNIYIVDPIIFAHYGPALKVFSDYDEANQPYARAIKMRGGLIHAGTDEAVLTPQNCNSIELVGFSDVGIIGTRIGLSKSGKYAIYADNGATKRSQSLTIADCEIFGDVLVNNTDNIRIGRNEWITQLLYGWAEGSSLTFGLNTNEIEIERRQGSFLGGGNQMTIVNNSAGSSSYPACSSGSKVSSKTVAVPASAVSVAVTGLGQPDADYIPTVTTTWATTVFVDESTKNTSGFTVRFGTAPVAGEKIYVSISREASVSFVV